jgi:Protein of unknown function (DUF3800)
MYLLYVDESGKSGLRDPRQPFFVLAGLAVRDSSWLAMESDLNERIDEVVPPPRDDCWELHMTDMEYGKGWFKQMPRGDREELRDAVLDVLDDHEPTLILTAIDKQKLCAQYSSPNDPEEIAYRYLIERFHYFLGNQGDDVGIMVSDEQKGAEDPIRRAHSEYRRVGTGFAVTDHVVETSLFVPSHWSRMLQIIDVVAWICNKTLREESRGEDPPPEWERIEPHLDGYPCYDGRGLKVFPK